MKKLAKRQYRLGKRAESQDETRGRIVQAAMELHEALGPRAASISAIADRAGVQRLTVYRHFPDDVALFRACTSQWLVENPPPDVAGWADVRDGEQRVVKALAALYKYYGRTERMWVVSHRDESEVSALAEPMAAFREYTGGIADDLARHWRSSRRTAVQVRATLRHAVSFPTWASLKHERLGPEACATLVASWLSGIA